MSRVYGHCVGMVVLMLFPACSSTSDKSEFEREQAKIEALLLEAYGEIPLDVAVSWGLVAPVAVEAEKQGTANFRMYDKGWDMVWEGEWEWDTVLFAACRDGSDQIVEMLLSRNADPSIRSGGALPIQEAWRAIYSQLGRANVASGEVPAEKVEQYKRILTMLALPEVEYEPRSEEAERSLALEVFTQHLNPKADEGGQFLKVNGQDCSTQTLKALHKRGFTVGPVSINPKRGNRHELWLNIRWISDFEADVTVVCPGMWGEQGRVTYAYGHWMFEIIDEMIF